MGTSHKRYLKGFPSAQLSLLQFFALLASDATDTVISADSLLHWSASGRLVRTPTACHYLTTREVVTSNGREYVFISYDDGYAHFEGMIHEAMVRLTWNGDDAESVVVSRRLSDQSEGWFDSSLKEGHEQEEEHNPFRGMAA